MNVEDIVRAHADERLAVPLAEIERRAGRRPRRFAYAGVAVAIALAAVVGIGAVPSEPDPAPTAAALDSEAFARFCAAEQERVHPLMALPPLRFRLQDGDFVVWVYGHRGRIVTCRRDGIVTYEPPSGGWTETLRPRVLAPEGPLSWVVGMIPRGTERVEVVLPSGRTVPADTNEEFYAASWTGEAAMPVKVVATTRDQIFTFEDGYTSARPR
ncbi:hypothetical protein GCM10022251_70460 [Phytohabitans flavus]|uniref:Uncharacterized protein n=1 Tax=Phytohabitans flavus TaxID=1076124 RepID=A0A6F8Y8Z7_9ACTN|nr:hypothetical protein [Phytohabitans flavus]BCB82431.1 hypothetical protein Pflav_088410 [Phytohabitans flavus]